MIGINKLNEIKINQAVQRLIDNAFDIELQSKHEKYPENYSDWNVEDVELFFRLKPEHPIIKMYENDKGYKRLNYKSYEFNFKNLEEYKKFKETKTPQEWMKELLVPWLKERTINYRTSEKVEEKLFNTPCKYCQEQTLHKCWEDIAKTECIRLICIFCNFIMPYDFELDKKLDADFDEKSRIITLFTAMKQKKADELVKAIEDKLEQEESIKGLKNEIATINRKLESYGK